DARIVGHRDRGASHLDRLEGVLDLEQSPVRREHRAGPVVRHLARLHFHRRRSSASGALNRVGDLSLRLRPPPPPTWWQKATTGNQRRWPADRTGGRPGAPATL